MQWQKEKIKLDNNTTVDAQAPIIISASRSQIFLHFIQIGLFQDGKLDILNGQILLMDNLYMYLLKIQDL